MGLSTPALQGELRQALAGESCPPPPSQIWVLASFLPPPGPGYWSAPCWLPHTGTPVEADFVDTLLAGLVNGVETGAWVLLLTTVWVTHGIRDQGPTVDPDLETYLSNPAYFCMCIQSPTQVPWLSYLILFAFNFCFSFAFYFLFGAPHGSTKGYGQQGAWGSIACRGSGE